MYRKLNLDRDKVDACRRLAKQVISPACKDVRGRSTVGMEAASLQFYGLDPQMASRFAQSLPADALSAGASLWLGRAMVLMESSAADAAAAVAGGKIPVERCAKVPADDARRQLGPLVMQAATRLVEGRHVRQRLSKAFLTTNPAMLLWHSGAADDQTADAVLASQAGMDWFWAASSAVAQQGLPALRAQLDVLGKERGAFVRLGVSAEAGQRASVAASALLARADAVSIDPLTDILCHKKSFSHSMIEARFAWRACAASGMHARLEAASLGLLANMQRDAHELLIAALLNEALAQEAGLSGEQFVPGHSLSLETRHDDELLSQLAHVQMLRELYVRSPISTQPASDEAGALPLAQTLSFISETSWLQVHAAGAGLAARLRGAHESASLLRGFRSGGDELLINPNGKVARRAHTVLENAHKILRRLEQTGLQEGLASGILLGQQHVNSAEQERDGTFVMSADYWNPIETLLMEQTERASAGV